MKLEDIKIGGRYLMKVSGIVTVVRVDAILRTGGPDIGNYRARHRTVFRCTNLRTGKPCTARSASKFRLEVTEEMLSRPSNPSNLSP